VEKLDHPIGLSLIDLQLNDKSVHNRPLCIGGTRPAKCQGSGARDPWGRGWRRSWLNTDTYRDFPTTEVELLLHWGGVTDTTWWV